jgi:hypothetical protein
MFKKLASIILVFFMFLSVTSSPVSALAEGDGSSAADTAVVALQEPGNDDNADNDGTAQMPENNDADAAAMGATGGSATAKYLVFRHIKSRLENFKVSG